MAALTASRVSVACAGVRPAAPRVVAPRTVVRKALRVVAQAQSQKVRRTTSYDVAWVARDRLLGARVGERDRLLERARERLLQPCSGSFYVQLCALRTSRRPQAPPPCPPLPWLWPPPPRPLRRR
jgi:hypothetical protein